MQIESEDVLKIIDAGLIEAETMGPPTGGLFGSLFASGRSVIAVRLALKKVRNSVEDLAVKSVVEETCRRG